MDKEKMEIGDGWMFYYDWGYSRLDESKGLISCYDWDNCLLGTIIAIDNEWDLLMDGHDPITEGWDRKHKPCGANLKGVIS